MSKQNEKKKEMHILNSRYSENKMSNYINYIINSRTYNIENNQQKISWGNTEIITTSLKYHFDILTNIFVYLFTMTQTSQLELISLSHWYIVIL